MTTVAVTGITGFIGQNLASFLISKGFTVVGLTRSIPVDRSLFPNSLLREVDYASQSSLSDALHDVDVLVHLASLVHHPSSLYAPSYYDLYHTSIVDVTSALLIACSHSPVQRFVYISSAAVYGEKQVESITKCSPCNNYAIAKICAEEVVKSSSLFTDLSYVILRPPLVYSSNCPGNFAHLIRVLSIVPVNIFPALNSLRSFISLDNMLNSIYYACISPAVVNRTYVVADPVAVSVSQIASTYYAAPGTRYFFSLWIPRSIIRFLLFLACKNRIWSKISTASILDPSQFLLDTGYQPDQNSMPPCSIRSLF